MCRSRLDKLGLQSDLQMDSSTLRQHQSYDQGWRNLPIHGLSRLEPHEVLCQDGDDDDNDADDEFTTVQDANDSSGYISSGTSTKIAPGKRIKWRHAIKEEDSVRQNLSIAFKHLR